MIDVYDEALDSMVSTKISELVVDTDPLVQSVAPNAESGLITGMETLNAVFVENGDWLFYEITVDAISDGMPIALNTTDDHGWVVVDEEGKNGCLVAADLVEVGDYVLVLSQDSDIPTPAKVTKTRSFESDKKYFAHTDSGLIVANGVVTSILCEFEANDCAADIPLADRLEKWLASEEEQTLRLFNEERKIRERINRHLALKNRHLALKNQANL